jgi:transcriptional antiterminator NusG
MRKHWQVRDGLVVRIIDGPFTGFRGEVKEVGERSVKVTVQVYGRDTPVDLSFAQIELAPEDSN